METRAWLCSECGNGNIGTDRCGTCHGARRPHRVAELRSLLGTAPAPEPEVRSSIAVAREQMQEEEEEDVQVPMNRPGPAMRVLSFVLGLCAAAGTVVVLAIFSFFLGIVVTAFL